MKIKISKMIGLFFCLAFLSASSFAQTYKMEVLKDISVKINKKESFEDMLAENQDEVPVCSEQGLVGELDCYNRLYVDRTMLSSLIKGGSYEVNGEIFNSYAEDKINTYHVEDMSRLFWFEDVIFPINNWDVSNVIDMSSMFYKSENFNQNIGKWNVSGVMTMEEMFEEANSFNQDIGEWDILNVENMKNMFSYNSAFDRDISSWNTCGNPEANFFKYGSSVLSDKNTPLFGKCINKQYAELEYDQENKLYVNENILRTLVDKGVSDYGFVTSDGVVVKTTYGDNDINVSNITNMNKLFRFEDVKFSIVGWNVVSVNDMFQMFYKSRDFNQNIGGWDVSSVIDMEDMFEDADSFNQDISGWDTGNVRNMYGMFNSNSSFNQDISGWDVCNVEESNFFKSGALLNSDYVPDFSKVNCN